MDELQQVDFLENVVYPLSLVVGVVLALFARYWRINQERKSHFNKVFALGSLVYQLLIIPESPTLLSVWTLDRKRLFIVVRVKNKWYLQDSANKKSLVTMKNGNAEKFIMLSNATDRANSPLNTSPSILKVERGWLSFRTHYQTDFSYGSKNTLLRWVGLNHLEIIYKENDPYTGSSPLMIHQRVAICKEYYDGAARGYLTYFDYEKVNVEVLISTFMFALLDQRSKFRGVLKKPKKQVTFGRIMNYIRSRFI